MLDALRTTVLQKWRFIPSMALAIGLFPGLLFSQTRDETPVDGGKFNQCLSALQPSDLVDPGVRLILEDIGGTSEYKNVRWNINRPFKPDAINVLVPQGNTIWPSACNLIAEPAGCETSPSERYIICNPPIGAQLSSPLVRSGVANLETNFAKRFLLMTFIGHELGHLLFHSQGTRYLEPSMLKWMQPYGMTCDQTAGATEPSEEERADVYGLAEACEALHHDPDFGLLPTEPAQVITVLQRLEDDLDDTYFTTDDACVREDSYPSISRRKHTFLLAYLKCLYPTGWNPVAAVAEADASSFEHLESWLRDRQISGFVASGSYAKGALYSHRIAKAGGSHYVTFDSTGIDSTLWYVAPPVDGLVAKRILSWPTSGQAIWIEDQQGLLIFYLLLNHVGHGDRKAVMQVAVNCHDGHPNACDTKVRTRELSEGLAIARGTDGSVVVEGRKRIESYRSFDDFFAGSSQWSEDIVDLPADPEQSVLAPGSNRTAIVTKSDAGFYSTIVVRNGIIARRALFVFPDQAGTIEAAAFAGDRLLLSIYRKPIAGEGSLSLWDCPASVLDTNEKTVARTCHVYQAPEALKSSVAMATRNLSSLFERSVAVAPSACGQLWIVAHGGWLWLLNGSRKQQDALPAEGLVSCDQPAGAVETYRARRVDHLETKFFPTNAKDSQLTSLPQLNPK